MRLKVRIFVLGNVFPHNTSRAKEWMLPISDTECKEVAKTALCSEETTSQMNKLLSEMRDLMDVPDFDTTLKASTKYVVDRFTEHLAVQTQPLIKHLPILNWETHHILSNSYLLPARITYPFAAIIYSYF